MVDLGSKQDDLLHLAVLFLFLVWIPARNRYNKIIKWQLLRVPVPPGSCLPVLGLRIRSRTDPDLFFARKADLSTVRYLGTLVPRVADLVHFPPDPANQNFKNRIRILLALSKQESIQKYKFFSHQSDFF